MKATFSRQEILAEDEVLLGCAEQQIPAQLPRRLHHVIGAWANRTPDAMALVTRTRRLDYRALDQAVAETRQFLLDQGVRPGDRVMLVGENGALLMCLFLALSDLDGVAVVTNARLSARELDLIEQDSDPRRVVYTIDDSVDAAAHADRKKASRHRLSVGGLSMSAQREVEPEATGLDAAEQVLAMIYTTGTTGTPKGVMLTQRNLMFIAFVSGRLRGIRAGDAVYCVLPMSHVFGLSAVSCSVLFSGGCAHLVPRFDAKETLRALAEEDIVGFLGVPTMYALMLEALQALPDWRAPKLRFMYSGGAPLDPGIKARVERTFGMPLHNGYGLTESGPTICQTRLYAPLASCAVGFPLPGVDIRIVAGEGREAGPGEVGELWARGPNIMKGYFRRPDLTAEVLKDGWLNTGDLVFQDETGAIHISGRTKELIIRSGFNVYPVEVENVLNAWPGVSISAVIGMDAGGGNEAVVAFVQPVAGETVDVADLLAYARQQLAGYKVPARIVVMDELPAAPSGKILKHQLKREGDPGN